MERQQHRSQPYERSNEMKIDRTMRQIMARVLLSLAIVLLATAPVGATGVKEQHEQLGSQVDRAQALALATLKQIKQLDRDCRGADGMPLAGKQADARTRLARIEHLVTSFDDVSEQAFQGLSRIEKDLRRHANDPGLASVREDVPRLDARLKKLSANVHKYFDRSVGAFGSPQPTAGPMASLDKGSVLAISGEVTGGLGLSGYNRPNVNPSSKASATDMSLGVNGRLLPARNTNILFNLGHNTTVQRRKIGITRFGTSVLQTLPGDMIVSGGLNYMHYSDKAVKAASYGDFGLFAKFAIDRPLLHFDTKVQHVGRSYSNVEFANYGTLTLQANGVVPAGVGHLKLRLLYLKRSHDDLIDVLNHKEFNPSAVWVFAKGGSEAGISYQVFSYPNSDDSSLDNTRLKAHLHLKSRRAGRSSKFGPEVALYRHPDDNNRNYTDLKLIRHTTRRGGALTTTSWEAVYRIYKDTLQFDFAQITRRLHRRPIGAGGYLKFDFAGRFYTGSSGGDSLFQFAYMHPAHTADFYVSFGWSKSGTGWLQRLSFGPSIGAKFYLDTERADVFDDSVVDVDFIWRNPQNTARVGFEVSLVGATMTGITWRAEAKYQMAFLYNADPRRTTNLLEINSAMTYPVTDRWLVDGYAKLHRTRASVEAASDLDKSGIGVKVRYLFDFRR